MHSCAQFIDACLGLGSIRSVSQRKLFCSYFVELDSYIFLKYWLHARSVFCAENLFEIGMSALAFALDISGQDPTLRKCFRQVEAREAMTGW